MKYFAHFLDDLLIKLQIALDGIILGNHKQFGKEIDHQDQYQRASKDHGPTRIIPPTRYSRLDSISSPKENMQRIDAKSKRYGKEGHRIPMRPAFLSLRRECEDTRSNAIKGNALVQPMHIL